MLWRTRLVSSSHCPVKPYHHMGPWSSLVQVIARHMFCTKPLPKPMMKSCQLDPKGQSLAKFESKYRMYSYLHPTKIIWKCLFCKIAAMLFIPICDENFFKISFPFQFWHGATVVIKIDQICPMEDRSNVNYLNPLRPSDACNPTIIGSDDGLLPGRRQAIFRTNAWILLIGPLGKTSVKFSSKFIYFHSRKCIWKCRLQNDGRFVSASMC